MRSTLHSDRMKTNNHVSLGDMGTVMSYNIYMFFFAAVDITLKPAESGCKVGEVSVAQTC